MYNNCKNQKRPTCPYCYTKNSLIGNAAGKTVIKKCEHCGKLFEIDIILTYDAFKIRKENKN